MKDCTALQKLKTVSRYPISSSATPDTNGIVAVRLSCQIQISHTALNQGALGLSHDSAFPKTLSILFMMRSAHWILASISLSVRGFLAVLRTGRLAFACGD